MGPSRGRGPAHGSRASLLQQVESLQAPISHPCWPTGYQKNLLLSSVYDSPCTEKERPSLALNTTVTVVGTGNGTLCALRVSKLFDFSTCSFSRCSFDGIFQPEVSGKFIVSAAVERGSGRAARRAGAHSPLASPAAKPEPTGGCLCRPHRSERLFMVGGFAPSLSLSCLLPSLRPSLPSSTRWTSSRQ